MSDRRVIGLLVVATSLVLAGCGEWDDQMGTSGTPPYYTPPTNEVDQEEPLPGDQYEAPGTNPFVVAAHDPLSTFAADVDTASYDIFRRDVGEYNALPSWASVRLEEYVNAFDYDYPVPSEDATAPFSIELTAAPSPFSATTLVAIGIQGIEVPVERKPANLVFLVDTSGSMSSADKLPLVQTLLTESLDVLLPSDTLSIVTYAGNVSVRLEPTPVSERRAIEQAISGLYSAGSTNGAGGIQLAYQQAEEGFIDNGINHVLLCTDGDFNIGISSTDALVALIEEKRETGITLTALGFGAGNLNDAMMEAVTNAGNGIYSVIVNEDHAIQYAHEDLLATFIQIAKDVKIQVEFNPERVHAYRLLGYENRALEDDDFRNDRIDAGEIGSGHTVTALYELVMAGDSVPDAEGAPELDDGEATGDDLTVLPEELCRIRIRYKEPGASAEDQAYEVQDGLNPESVLASFDMADGDFQWATAIAAFAEILKKSPYAHPEALDTIESIVDAHAGTLGDRLEFQWLFEKSLALMD